MTQDAGTPDRAAVLEQVRIPAWGLVVGGVLGLVNVAASPFYEPMLQDAMIRWFEQMDANAAVQLRHDFANPSAFDTFTSVAGKVFGALMSLVIVLGGLWMKDLRSWGLALTASILSLGCCGCCVVGLPAGIWSLIVLCRPEVKAAFAASAKR